MYSAFFVKRLTAIVALVLVSVFAPGAAVVAGDQEGPRPATVFDNPAPLIVSDPSSASLRGLHVVDSSVAWSSGSKGTVLRSTNGGQTWQTVSPPGAEEFDFRDVHAWNEREAIVMSSGTPSRFYRTEDGGTTWAIVHEDKRPEAFFDAIAFMSEGKGLAFSDPVDGRLLLLESRDAGKSWQELPQVSRPMARSGEAAFAASGTCLVAIDDYLFLGLGGSPGGSPGENGDANKTETARIIKSEDAGASWQENDSGIASGKSAGVFSIAMANRDHGVAVGGDYEQPSLQARSASFTTDGGQTWRPSETPPRGYRSCAAAVPGTDGSGFVCSGPTGCDITADGGRNWRALTDEGFHSIAISRDGALAVASGADGKIGVWRIGKKD